MRKKITLFLLAFGTAFVLTACSTEKPDVPGSNVRNGNGTSADMDVAGADWRTTGIVFADGTITRGGEDTDVLVCVHRADAAFYYDDAVQTLYDTVEYPKPISKDPMETCRGIDFSDLNGDGNSDVTMRFEQGEGITEMTWLWDADRKQYVFQKSEMIQKEEHV